MNLPRSHQSARISGVAGLEQSSPSVANFNVATTHPPGERINVTAIVVQRVTCDLPLQPVSFDLKWNMNVTLADPDFGIPGKVDLLHGLQTSCSRASGLDLLAPRWPLKPSSGGFWQEILTVVVLPIVS